MTHDLDRRAFLKWSGMGVAAAGLGWPLKALSKDGKPPNIIVILADDLGAAELGCYGHPTHKTPILDSMAQKGVQFRMCYATPLCHPTRFMIMTGQYGHHNGVYNFAGRRGGPDPRSPEENIATHVNFAQCLKAKGYATALSGKWQLSGEHPTLIHEAGFDEYIMWAYKHNLPAGTQYQGGFEGEGDKTARYWNPSIVKNGQYIPTKPDDYGPDMHVDFIIDFMTRHKEGPFLVYHTLCLTHGPHYKTPDTSKTPEDRVQDSFDNFGDCVAYADKMVGRIQKAVEDLGLRDNTVILFTGDNGTGGHGKGQATELGARVPMIAYGPGVVKPQGPVDALTDLTDVLPTVVSLAGADLPKEQAIDGHDITPVLMGKSQGDREWIYSYLGDERILRDHRWLLENNSPYSPGRFFDCGNHLDGQGYVEVTDSQDPEVLAARKRFEEILADKPVPQCPPPSAEEGGRKGKRKE